MAKITVDGVTYQTDSLNVDVAAIIEKIKKAKAGENVPGVSVVQLPKPTEDTKESSFSLATAGLVGALGLILLKPIKPKEKK